MTDTVTCTHPTYYAAGPREGLCSKCGERAFNPDWLTEVKKLLTHDRFIGAIKVWREAHPGVGLKDSKNAVDAIREEFLPATTPVPQEKVDWAQAQDLQAAAKAMYARRITEDLGDFIERYGYDAASDVVLGVLRGGK